MKGYAMLKIGSVGWVEKERPACGAMDAICKPLGYRHLALPTYIPYGRVLSVNGMT